ncbi:MAG TPA: NAD-dependent epimerase/dehydratase family protein [Thermoanaerobaculia bacterium]|nr:NAD-dependent epimerase/dehydratase family protein [Thermoanaerobaculia bacterium]
MARVLIAGCGYVGVALGELLARRGDTVLALRRRVALLPADLTPIAADLGDPRSLGALPSSLDAVVYAAAPASGDEAAYEAVYQRGLANLLDAVERRHAREAPPRLVLLSSTSVYGQTRGEWVDETSPTVPLDFRGRLVLRGEEIIRASGMPAVALRLGGIYGPGRTSLVDSVRAGRAPRSRSAAPRFTNRIHRDDAAGAILHLLDMVDPWRVPEAAPAAPGGASTGSSASAATAAATYIGVDEEPAERDEVLLWLARRLGAPSPSAAPARRETTRVETNKRCSSAKLRAAGYRFRFPTFREGYEDLLRQEVPGG